MSGVTVGVITNPVVRGSVELAVELGQGIDLAIVVVAEAVNVGLAPDAGRRQAPDPAGEPVAYSEPWNGNKLETHVAQRSPNPLMFTCRQPGTPGVNF